MPDAVADADVVRPGQVRYVFPDFPVDRRLVPDLSTRYLTARLGVEMIADWTGFAQDAISVAQVGDQANRFEVRSARLQLIGGILDDYRLSYRVAFQYRGFDIDPQRNWDLADAAVTWLINSRGSRVNIGQIRETFSYETIGSTASMPQSERILGLFAASRNIGISATHVFGADRDWTASVGLYRDSFGFSGSGAGATARLTHLLWEDAAAGRYLHLGVAWRKRPDDDGMIRYRGRPGSNVASNFVDTGEFAARGANHFGVEGLWSDGGFSVLGEYIAARVTAPTRGNPWFQGFYVTGSWVLSGESRPYDRVTAQARRIVPKDRWGAPEITARYSAVDLDGGDVRGGSFDRIDLGFNWWATTRWKWGVVAGRTWLRQQPIGALATRGRTDSLLLRAQWVY
jgi:phosphate-selective porin OprO/OprP